MRPTPRKPPQRRPGRERNLEHSERDDHRGENVGGYLRHLHPHQASLSSLPKCEALRAGTHPDTLAVDPGSRYARAG